LGAAVSGSGKGGDPLRWDLRRINYRFAFLEYYWVFKKVPDLEDVSYALEAWVNKIGVREKTL
jgi:hypothetical protein